MSQRERVYAVVREALQPLDADLVGRALGIAPTTARFHLNALTDAGLVHSKSLHANSVGRPRKGYEAARPAAIPSLLQALAAELGAQAAQRHERAVSAGRRWADSLTIAPADPDVAPDPVSVAVSTMSRLGFQVGDVTSIFGTHEIHVCNCPLRALADNTPEVVNGLQQGLIERAFERGAPLLAAQYAVSVEPGSGGDCGVLLWLTRR